MCFYVCIPLKKKVLIIMFEIKKKRKETFRDILRVFEQKLGILLFLWPNNLYTLIHKNIL